MSARMIFFGFRDDLEKEFHLENLHIGIKYIRFSILVAGLLTIAFGFFNLLQPLPDSSRPAMPAAEVVHCVLCSVLALAFFISTFSRHFPRFAYPGMYAYFFLFGVDICVWLSITPTTELAYLVSYSILAFLCVGFYVGTHIRFIFAVVCGILMIVIYMVTSLYFNRLFESGRGMLFLYGIFYFLFFIGSNVLGIAGSYTNEFFRRHIFLLRKQIRVEEEAARRRAFDEWKAAYLKFREFNGKTRHGKRKTAAKTSAISNMEQVKDESMAELLDTFSRSDGYGRVFERIMDFVLEISGSTRGAIAVRDDRSGRPVYIVRRGIAHRDTALVSGIVAETFSSGEPIIVNLSLDRGDAAHRQAARETGVRSLLCFPVELQGIAIGACYLDKGWSDDEFSGESDELIISLVTQVVLSVSDLDRRDPEPPVDIDMAVFNSQCEKLALTPRERQLALLVARGYSKRKICDTLFISVNTLRTHLKSINAKAAVTKRSELLRVLSGGKPVSREQETLAT